jgi:hypothetical protein
MQKRIRDSFRAWRLTHSIHWLLPLHEKRHCAPSYDLRFLETMKKDPCERRPSASSEAENWLSAGEFNPARVAILPRFAAPVRRSLSMLGPEL